ncbi:MAG: prepilin-type N-terminal cleavage/methylation domain-containing protein [Cyanobacteria bacterium NC_groundwater_1444_Ag_S-0.65um_54_12]|nr:prepilin-type N-terminal cleavage/methylation domain-containing protein [Cyanobacteria bacterium NC_groundwater_1444_Ag_S-0.65um_54_12]
MVRVKAKQSGGFTLIELLVVVVIIGILASVAIPNFMGAQDKAKNAGVQTNAHTVQMALEQYAVDNASVYPASLNEAAPNKVVGQPEYIQAYPKTPWGFQQAAKIDTSAADELKQNGATLDGGAAGDGSAAIPTDSKHYGAIAYKKYGTASEQYVIIGSGKKANKAVIATRLQNF